MNEGNSSSPYEEDWLQTTTRQTRRLQVWLKHSVVSHLVQPEPTFSAAGSNQNHNKEEADQIASSLTRRFPSSASLTSSATISNIDQALQQFHRPDLDQYFPILEDRPDTHDWILDGYPEWHQQALKTQALLQQLQGEPLRVEDLIIHFGSIGNQEYQFAQFDQNHGAFQDQDEDFGDFQAAPAPTITETLSEGRSISPPAASIGNDELDEFGDFQTALPDSATAMETYPANLPLQTIESDNDLRDFHTPSQTEVTLSAALDHRSLDISTHQQHPSNTSGNEPPMTSSSVDPMDHHSQVHRQPFETSSASPGERKVETEESTPTNQPSMEPPTPTTNNRHYTSLEQKESEADSKHHQEHPQTHLSPSSRNLQYFSPAPEEESSFASSSWQSNSIPSVVNFTSESPTKSRNIVVPTTIRASPRSSPENITSDLATARRLDYSSLLHMDFSSPHHQQHSENNKQQRQSLHQPTPKSSTNSPSRGAVRSPPIYLDDDDYTTSIMSYHSDIASPEGRFLRRHSQMINDLDDEDILSDHGISDEASLIRKVPDKYLDNPKMDDTVEVLKSIDWEFIPFWQYPRLLTEDPEEIIKNNSVLVQEQITLRLSELDDIHQQVTRRLHRTIQPHTRRLEKANQEIYDCFKNLAVAQMYADRLQSSIQQTHRGHSPSDAKRGSTKSMSPYGTTHTTAATSTNTNEPLGGDGGIVGCVELLQAWDSKHEYRRLLQLFQHVQDVFDLEARIQHRIQQFTVRTYEPNYEASLEECQAILTLVILLQQRAWKDNDLSRLQAMEDLRLRALQLPTLFSGRLLLLLESITVRACSHKPSLDMTEYHWLVESIFKVHRHSDPPTPSKTSTATAPMTSVDLATSWVKSIQMALHFEADRALAMALLITPDDDTEFDKELLTLTYQLEQEWGNSSPLKTIIHNLVTIRFDFQFSSHNHLPEVYHQLCILLTNVLHGHYSILQWHRQEQRIVQRQEPCGVADGKEETLHQYKQQHLAQVLQQLSSTSRVSLWNHCLHVLEQCLQEYFTLASKNNAKKLFDWKASADIILTATKGQSHFCDDTKWWDDVQGLEDICRLTDQFLSLQPYFFEGTLEELKKETSNAFVDDGSSLKEVLGKILKKHLRSVHIEAMNSLGSMLSKEDWSAISLDAGSSNKQHTISQNAGRDTQVILYEVSTSNLIDLRADF